MLNVLSTDTRNLIYFRQDKHTTTDVKLAAEKQHTHTHTHVPSCVYLFVNKCLEGCCRKISWLVLKWANNLCIVKYFCDVSSDWLSRAI